MPLEESPIEGVFVKELKNRFLCEVLINDTPTECYVPSSCRLDNFLDLRGKRVLMLPTRTPKARTGYSLLAVPYKRNYMLLNTSKVNCMIADNLGRRFFSALGKRSVTEREHQLGSYRCDLFLPNSDTIIEIKSVISTDSIAEFPTVYSQRTIDQLKSISALISDGYKAALIIVSLSPYVKQIHIDTSTLFFEALKPCIEKGLQLFAVTTCILNGEVRVKKKIAITY